jgi:hypothetical protein
MIKIFGIVYGDKQTEYEPFRNDKPLRPWRWENDPMISITDNLISDLAVDHLVGVFSHKFQHKTGLTKGHVYAAINPGYDVYNFSRKIGVPNFMNWSDEGHKGIKGFIQKCCEHTGLTYTNHPKHIIYANQFVAKKSVYVDYINSVIKPSLELLEGPLWVHVNKEAGYTRAMDREKLRMLTGLEFYNYVPFILERMMMQYIFSKKLKCIDVNHR